jgi:hypothetical protein
MATQRGLHAKFEAAAAYVMIQEIVLHRMNDIFLVASTLEKLISLAAFRSVPRGFHTRRAG